MKGEGEVFAKAGKSFDPVLIPKSLEDAGFTAAEVVLAADGTLAQRGGLLELVVPGLRHAFVLSDGAKVEELKSRNDLVGQRLHVIGKQNLSQLEKPQLTVAGWTLLSRP